MQVLSLSNKDSRSWVMGTSICILHLSHMPSHNEQIICSCELNTLNSFSQVAKSDFRSGTFFGFRAGPCRQQCVSHPSLSYANRMLGGDWSLCLLRCTQVSLKFMVRSQCQSDKYGGDTQHLNVGVPACWTSPTDMRQLRLRPGEVSCCQTHV